MRVGEWAKKRKQQNGKNRNKGSIEFHTRRMHKMGETLEGEKERGREGERDRCGERKAEMKMKAVMNKKLEDRRKHRHKLRDSEEYT